MNYDEFTELSSKVAIIDISAKKYAFNYIPVTFQESHCCLITATIYSCATNFSLHTVEYVVKHQKKPSKAYKRIIDTLIEAEELTPEAIDQAYYDHVIALYEILASLRSECQKHTSVLTGKSEVVLPEVKIYNEEEDKVKLNRFIDPEETVLVNFSKRVPDYDEEYLAHRILTVSA